MPKIPVDTKSGFLLGIGLLAAFAIWGVVQLLVSRAAHAAEGKASGS
jgi:hypothetical protein